MNMLTASTFRWTYTCHRGVWRDVHLEQALRDKPSMLVAEILNAGVLHEEKIYEVTAPHRQTITVKSWAEGVQITQRDMLRKAPVIMGAFLEVEIFNATLQKLMKLVAHSVRN